MEEGKQSRNWFKILLGVLLTFYGISAAVVSYQASQLDGIARDMNFTGIREMTRGNDAYAVADNQFTSDYDAITQVILLDQTGGSEAAIQVWMDTLSDEALDAMDRIGDLDDQYNAEVYGLPDLPDLRRCQQRLRAGRPDLGDGIGVRRLVLAAG